MRSAVILSGVLLISGACASGPRPADAPPAAARVSPDTGRGYTEADVRFVQGMIAHHAQALAMTALVPGRASRPELALLAERIDVSQQDEIAAMQAWLRERGLEVPAPGAHAHHPGELMPGMLTPEEMARLGAVRGAEFDRLFLESMIRHHEGAIRMVAALFAAGGGQESQLYQFAADVDADQRAEIDRMRRLLGLQ